ncbi:MAG TPA: 4-oxalomesaconate tautomerase [Kiloniellales bacterium]|nr:4-oxalomesaconate tautomerase [Kiloniellales bacterium]
MLTAIPCIFMRGGTSRGPFFLRDDLPEDLETLSRVLLAVMGSPDQRQIDGLGGATTVTSKVAMISPAKKGPEEIDYFFGQVSLDRDFVDYGPTCGNMLAGIGPFAIESGLIPAADGETRVKIRAVNTGALVEAVVQTPSGRVTYEGDAAIDGVPGTAAPIVLNFMDAVGSKTGKLLPTGRVRDEIEGVEVTCLDVAMPIVIARAADLGKRGTESKAELDADRDFMARLETIRRAAGERMGMGDVADSVVPKFAIVTEPRGAAGITSRYFTPVDCHPTHAVTGAVCIATCAVLEGSVADGLSKVARQARETVPVEHPSGRIEVVLEVTGHGPDMTVERGGVVRTARPLMRGETLIPARVWPGRQAETPRRKAG